jgi:hypothetical protein
METNVFLFLGIPDFRNEKAGQSYRSLKSYHGEKGGGELAEVWLLILLATRGRNTPKSKK